MSASLRTSERRRSVRGGRDGLVKRTQAAKSGPRQVKIGLPKDASPYPDGTSVIKVGVIHEFGSEDGTIPERSWLRSAFRKNLKTYKALSAKLGARVQRGEMTMEEALEVLGTRAAADVRQQIVEVSSPPNAPSTVRQKGSSNPLIDTGHLRQEVTHQVVKKK